MIGRPDDISIVGNIEAYVKLVATFKAEVTNGIIQHEHLDVEVEKVDKNFDEFTKFTREFTGKKKGSRAEILDYVTYHGAIVNALYDWRSRSIQKDENVFNNLLIDLAVTLKNRLTEVYEIKTGTGRQSVYTAVGQLMMHSAGSAHARKIMVLPAEQALSERIKKILNQIGIETLLYTSKQKGIYNFV